MEKIKLKQTTKEVREEYRRQVKRLHKSGKSYRLISEILSISLITVKRYGLAKVQKRKSVVGKLAYNNHLIKLNNSN